VASGRLKYDYYRGEVIVKRHKESWLGDANKEDEIVLKGKDGKPSITHTSQITGDADTFLHLDHTFTGRDAGGQELWEGKENTWLNKDEQLVPHGQGEMQMAKSAIQNMDRGDRCQGTFNMGKLQGNATYWFANGDRFQGKFKDGDPDPKFLSKGIYEYANGDRYQGSGDFAGKRGGRLQYGNGTYWYAWVLKPGEKVTFRERSQQSNWTGMSETRLRFAKGDTVVVDTMKTFNGRTFFTTVREVGIDDADLWAPVSAVEAGDVYMGQFRNDRREGQGTQWYKREGDRFDGEWQNGEMHGWGVYWFGSGKVEYGAYVAGEPVRVSVRWSPERNKIWKFVDGKMQEQITAEDAETLCQRMNSCGRVRHPAAREIGLPPPPAHGQVIFKFSDGGIYEGTVVKGVMEGIGIYHFPSGSKYTGQFKANQKAGKGRMQYQDGTWFKGLFANDMKEGEGVLKYPGGDFYEGNFRADRREGAGEYWYADGSVLQSLYVNGRPVGKGVYWSPDRLAAGRLYDGKLVERQGVEEAAVAAEQLGFGAKPPPRREYRSSQNLTALDTLHEESIARAEMEKKLAEEEARRRRQGPPAFGEETMPSLPPPSLPGALHKLQPESPTVESGMVIFG
jgi:hypothetical protein